MGIKINTAIGWAMPWEDFHAHCLFQDHEKGDDIFMALEAHFEGTENMRHKPFKITDGASTLIDLIEFAGSGDDWDHVIFFPTSEWRKDWNRRGDNIDYAMFRGDSDDVPDSEFLYLDEGHYPFESRTMNPDGTDGPKRTSEDVMLKRPFIPGIPSMMRYWIEQSGIIDQAGIAKLRPIRARWWS